MNVANEGPTVKRAPAAGWTSRVRQLRHVHLFGYYCRPYTGHQPAESSHVSNLILTPPTMFLRCFRFGSSDIKNIASQMINALLVNIETAESATKAAENDHLMKCTWSATASHLPTELGLASRCHASYCDCTGDHCTIISGHITSSRFDPRGHLQESQQSALRPMDVRESFRSDAVCRRRTTRHNKDIRTNFIWTNYDHHTARHRT